MTRPRTAFLLVSWLTAAPIALGAPIDKATLRKTTSKDLSIEFERLVLSNGQVVLLNPDPSVSSVLVDQTFLAGALFEPAGKSGLAHLTEHLMSGGLADETDYQALLESRGGRDFNAMTTYDLMTFRVIVPAQELPVALWVAADRLGSRAGHLDDAEVARQRRIVVEERAIRIDDVAYGGVYLALHDAMFPAPNPLRGTILGVPAELASINASDVKAFVARCLVPANGFLTLSGNFDPATAREWLEKTVGRLRPGTRATPPVVMNSNSSEVTLTIPEPRSRRPRVTFAWRLGEVIPEVANVLEFGALLLRVYTDGAFGIDVDAFFHQHQGGAEFEIAFTMDHEGSKRDTRDNAEGLFRYLTRASAQDDIFAATLLAWDRLTMLRLDSLAERADLLERLECLGIAPVESARYNARHWALDAAQIQAISRKVLDVGRMTIHSRPTNPRPARPSRD